jgi:hypothetical protein
MINKPKNFGDDLAAFVMQSDYRMNHNGYGLLQLTANFAAKSSYSGSVSLTFPRGGGLPAGYAATFLELNNHSWTCVRADEVGKDGDYIMITAQYAAIDSNVNGGVITETEATITSSSVSEPITTHPNFTKRQLPQLGGTTPLGGKPPVSTLTINVRPTPSNPNAVDSRIRNPNNAKWVPSQTGQTTSYQFVDFLPQQLEDKDDNFNRKAGVRSYFRPSITMRLTGYTDSAVAAVDTCKYVWWSTKTGLGILSIPDIYKPILEDKLIIVSTDPNMKRGKDWLITGANMEVYGGLYKVTADLMLSGVAGWDPDIYPALTNQTVGI